jgi:hypothetical protein
MVAALRGAVALVAVISAAVGAVAPVSWAWLAPALALVGAWTAVYVRVAWTRGLRAWLIAADLAIAGALCLAVGHLVPTAALPGTTSWVSIIASMTVVSAQLGGTPAVSVPAALIVVASHATGQRIAHSTDGGLAALPVMAVQILLGAAVMMVAMRIERTAIRAFSRLQEAESTAALALARREDERAQLRMVHNGPLTVLTMALHAGAAQPTATLRHRAAAVLNALPRLAAVGAPGDGGHVRLDELVSQVAVWYSPPLRIAADLHPVLVPADVADAITGAVSEALENTARHAATDRVSIVLRENAGTVRATVIDAGRGFRSEVASGHGFGLREDLVGRMAAIGGTAMIRSAPAAGSAVELEWRHG